MDKKKNLINVASVRKKKNTTNADAHTAIIHKETVIVDLITILNMKIHVAAQKAITGMKNIIKATLVGINEKRVDRNIYSFCCIKGSFAYNTLDVIRHLEGEVG